MSNSRTTNARSAGANNQPDGPSENRFRKWSNRAGPTILIGIFLLLVLSILLFNRIFIFIKPGEEGVLWSRFFGTKLQRVYTEGMTVIWPWDIMYIYDVRVQQVQDKFHVLTRDGLSVDVDISIRYHPRKSALPFLHVEVGPDYVEKVVKPEIRANLRYLMGQYTPAEIYTSQGFLIRRTVENSMPELAERHIVLDDLLIKAITLPRSVQLAIEDKMRQQQAYLEYEFRLQREDKERERKKIEAEGIRDFMALTQAEGEPFRNFLTYLGVYATLALAQSDNAKIVMIGNRGEGLPLMLSLPDTPKNTSTNLISTNGNLGVLQNSATNSNQFGDLHSRIGNQFQELMRKVTGSTPPVLHPADTSQQNPAAPAPPTTPPDSGGEQ